MSAVKRTKAKELANHGPCPCGESSDAYTEYEDGHSFCYSCNKPFFPKGDTLKPTDLEKKIIGGYRGISEEACRFLGIWSYVDEDDNVLFREYEATEGSKFRRCPKESMWVTGKYPALWGTHLWNAGSSHYVTVVEGEEDVGAFYDMMMLGKKTKHPVVALTSASISARGRKEIYDYLSKFQTVKLAFEDDEPGRQAKLVLREMLPNKIREVPLTKHKDANDYLLAGDADEFKRAWDNASVFTPDNIYHTEEDVRKVLENEEVESYVQTPFDDLNDVIKGLPLNHVVLITGMEGIGKTEILRAMEFEALYHGKKIAVLHHEETKKTLYKALACYKLGKNTRDPDKPVAEEEVLGAIKDITKDFQNLFVFEFRTDPDVNTILEQINYLVHVCGVEYVFIDPINQFDPIDETSKVEFLDDLSKKVAKYVTKNPVGMVWTAHVDDEGRTRNSRMISKACSIRIDLFRDLMAEDEKERNTTALYVAKNRPFSKTGFAGVGLWDEATFTMIEGEGHSYSFTYDDNSFGAEVPDEEPKSDILPFE